MLGGSTGHGSCRIVTGLCIVAFGVGAVAFAQAPVAGESDAAATEMGLDAQIDAVLQDRYRLSPADLISRLRPLLREDLSGVPTSLKLAAYNAVGAANERLARDAQATAFSDPAAERKAQQYIDEAVEAYVEAGTIGWENREVGSADRAFTTALNYRPNYPPALLGMARVYAGTNRALQAIETYQAYISATGRGVMEPDLYVEMADAYISLSLWNQAVRSLEEAIRIGRETDEVASKLARCYMGRGDAAKALEKIQLATKLNPGKPDYFIQYADLLVALQRYGEAVDVAAASTRVARRNYQAAPYDAELLRELRRCLDMYIGSLSRVLQDERDDVDKILLLTELYEEQAAVMRSGSFLSALQLLAEAPPSVRDTPRMLERLVELQHRVNHPELRGNCERLLRMQPGNQIARDILAELDAATQPAS